MSAYLGIIMSDTYNSVLFAKSSMYICVRQKVDQEYSGISIFGLPAFAEYHEDMSHD